MNLQALPSHFRQNGPNFTVFLISFAGLVRVGEAHSLGKSSGTGDVCLPDLPPDLPPSLRSDLTHF